MIAVALKGFAARKLRALLTAIAIVLGVAMVSGTLMLTDSVQRAFDSIFASAYQDTDAVVTGKSVVDYSTSGKATVPAALLPRVRTLPGVAAAAGAVGDLGGDSGKTTLYSVAGKKLGSNQSPSFGFGIDASQPRFNPLELDRGRFATGPGEVVIDTATAKDAHLAVGDQVDAAGNGPLQRFRIVGTASYGGVALGGATIAAFDVPTAQKVLRKPGLDAIQVAAKSGTSQAELVRQIRTVLPSTAVVRSGDAQASEDGKSVSEGMSFIRYFLLSFGGIALLVGGFVIFNTMSITVAQRTRELATLRTLGATRRQVLRSVITEALALGVVASIVGLVLGAGLAKGLLRLFDALGLGLPRAGMALEPRTIIVALSVGTVVTLLSGLLPAVRATRVAPIAAVREGAEPPRGRFARVAPYVALGVTLLAVASLAYGTLADGVSTAGRVLSLVGGVLALFLGTAMLAPTLVRPLAAVVGLPSRRFGGAAGELARRNAVRNPGRTATTAAALMIGLALVVFVSTLGNGLIKTNRSALEKQVVASHVVTSENGWDAFPIDASGAIAKADGVRLATPVRGDTAKLGSSDVTVSGVQPAGIARAYHFNWKQGDDATVAGLGGNGAVIREDFAKDHHLAVGSPLRVRTANGSYLGTTVRGIYDPPAFDPLLGDVVVSVSAFDRAFPRPGDMFVFVQASSDALPAIQHSLGAFPDTTADDRAGWVDTRSNDAAVILNLMYVLLALSVIVSLFGMVNTLALAVFERTRELGMLRAVGLSRRQTRRMVRHESVITALIGAALGLPLGLLLAGLVTKAFSSYDVEFAIPPATIVVAVVVAIVGGILAAALPARRAARIDVLHALQYE